VAPFAHNGNAVCRLMKQEESMRRWVVAAVAFALLAGAGAVFARDTTTVNVPFKFTVDKTVMPAGMYEITVDDQAGTIALSPPSGRQVVAPFISRLGERQQITTAEFVFDAVQGSYMLSELWLPGADGYLISAMKQPHTHQVIKAEKKGK
jgi:hypothetical protein